MSNEITVLDPNQLPSTQLGTDEGLADLAKSADFIGRLQLFTKGKAIDKGLVRPGHYGIPESADEIEDLGDTIDIVPLARKPKAIDMSDKDAIIVSHDQESEEFQRICAQAQEKESNCMYGPSFLVFERSTGRFLEFFCGSKSTRAEAKKLYPFLPLSAADLNRKRDGGADVEGVEPHGPLPATLTSRHVEKGAWSWHVPVIKKCSAPIAMPKHDVVVREITRFLTTKGDGIEKMTEDKASKRRAR